MRKIIVRNMIKMMSDKPLVMVDHIEFDSPYRLTLEEAEQFCKVTKDYLNRPIKE